MSHKNFLSLFLFTCLLACSNSTKDDAPVSANESTDSAAKDSVATETRNADGSFAALTGYSKTLPLDKLQLPKGFKVAVYAEVLNARSLAISPGGTVYVGNRDEDKVYAIQDTDGDFTADKKWVVATGLKSPNGVAFKDGDLYIAEISRISKLSGIENSLANPPAPVVINDKYPSDEHHGWKYIAFGPDGKLYVPVGAPCNICESKDEIYASITRLNADGSGREIVAKGVRNTVGFTWHPETKELWFTDNGRDMLGDDTPNCELNVVSKAGMHFGYPYCHEGSLKDPEFGNKRACNEFVPPVQKLGPHVAPLGLKFYTGAMFPPSYRNQIFVAKHGSWNRSKKSGYDLSLVKIENNKSVGYETFIKGWLDDASQKVWGRPVDVLQLKDGSLLVSDDYANVIYRISYENP
jgi:glucose/arabinose dehydrogenase